MKKNGCLRMAVVVLLCVRPLSCEEPKMALPKSKVAPELVKLSFLVGEFAPSTKIYSNPVAPKGETAKGQYKSKWALDSMFVVFEEAIEFPIFGKYRGMGVLGYDREEKKYILSMFNNFGDHPAYKGNFAGDTLILEGQVPFEGGSFTQQVVWLPEGKNLKLWVRNNVGQGWVTVIERTYATAGKASNSSKK